MKFKCLFLLFILVFVICNAQAQVTIGSAEKPEKGALLQLKDMEANAENETATKGGLLMPRTKLVSKSTLEPFILNNDDFNNNVDNVKESHIGLVVYNLEDTSDGLESGMVVWNGAEWETIRNESKESFFYMPSFNLPIENLGENNFPIYAEYFDQFTAAGLAVYSPEKIEFKVSYFDPTVINNISFPAEFDNMVMQYNVLSTTAPEGAHINIIIVVK